MLEPEVERVDERFQHFYREHFAQTARLARMLTGDPDVADDLAQDAFVRVYRYAQGSSRPIDKPAALLRTTTVNLCRSWHTSQRRLQLRMARHGADAESLTEWEHELDDSLRRLPYDQRAVVVLRYWLGLRSGDRRVAPVPARHRQVPPFPGKAKRPTPSSSTKDSSPTSPSPAPLTVGR